MPRAKRKKQAPPAETRESALRRFVAAVRGHPVAVLMFVSIAIGCAWMIRSRPVPFSDFLDYYQLAKDILDERQFGYPIPTARRLPGYPALLALFMLVSRSYIWLGILNIMLTAALAPVAYKLALALTNNRRTAIVAAALCALNPTFVFFSPILASEHLFVLLFFSSLLPLFSSGLPPGSRFGLSGALLGLAVLTRGEALFYIPVVLFVAWTAADGGVRRKAALSAVLVGACVVVLTPWIVRNRVVIGPGVGLTTTSGNNLYYGHNSNKYGYHKVFKKTDPKMSETERQSELTGRALGYLRTEPSRLLGDIAVGTPQLLWQKGTYAVRTGLVRRTKKPPFTLNIRKKYPAGLRFLVQVFYRMMLFLVVSGLLFWRRIGRNKFIIFYGMIVCNWICYSVVFWSKPRFRYTAEAAMCIFSAFVLYALWEEWQEYLEARRRKAAVDG